MPKLLEQACGSLCCKIVYGVLVEGFLNLCQVREGLIFFVVVNLMAVLSLLEMQPRR